MQTLFLFFEFLVVTIRQYLPCVEGPLLSKLEILVQTLFVFSETNVNGRICVNETSKPGTRCIEQLAADYDGDPDNTMCVEMSCSAEGEVLINGNPCNPRANHTPPTPMCTLPPATTRPLPDHFQEKNAARKNKIEQYAVCFVSEL